MGPGVSPPLWPSAERADRGAIFNLATAGRRPYRPASGPKVHLAGAVVARRRGGTRSFTPEEPPNVPEYRLDLDVDFEGRRWSGRIEFELPDGAPSFALDADELEITEVTSADRPIEFRVEADRQRVVLPAVGPGPVAVRFRGTVSETGLQGLYRSRQGGGYVLTTQCEPIGARRIFPCFDRPDRKSRILLRVRTDPELTVISNTIERSTHHVGAQREWTFYPTPSMSAYLFYLGIGKFDVLEETHGSVRFRIFTPPGQSAMGQYGLVTTPRILGEYERYYGIPYPLPKLDLVCIAETSFGAMENWGAITFRDTRLLVDASTRSLARRDVLETIAHEVAHMWFGNLVTMASWSDIWLNESLASFLETKIASRVEPGIDLLSDFFLRVAGTGAAIEGDSLAATHAVRAPVQGADEIAQIFDEISYGKGSTLIAMLESYLGEEPFRAGVARYLGRFRFANAETKDLWAALSETSGEPIAPLMDPWLDRPGLPVIDARLVPAGIELTQRRFSFVGPLDAPPWPIPMVVELDGARERLRFETRTHTISAPATATVHLNPGAAGFYRVHYDPTLTERLLGALPTRPQTDRWSFLEDLGAFVIAGQVDWATYARAVRTLGLAPDRLVVDVLAGTLGPLSLFFPDSPAVLDLARWFFAQQFARLGPRRRPGEPDTEGILRERVSFGRMRIDLGFARELSEMFVDWEQVDPDLKPAVAAARARIEGAAGYRELRRALDGPLPEDEREIVEQALVWTAEPALVRESLDRLAAGDANLGTVPLVLRNAAANPKGRDVLWSWMTERLPRVDEILRGSGLLASVFEITLPILGLGRGAEMRAFFASHSFPEGARGIAKGLERLTILERAAPRFRELPP
jgi:tricorn protease interacting factor F2/3